MEIRCTYHTHVRTLQPPITLISLQPACSTFSPQIKLPPYFKQYFNSFQVAITVLLPICNIYRDLAGIITYLYPLATKLFTVYSSWHQIVVVYQFWCQILCFNHSTKGCHDGRNFLNQFCTVNLHYFQMVPI